jgi:anti-anti-sigma regulatory factor
LRSHGCACPDDQGRPRWTGLHPHLSGDLDFPATGGLLKQAALAVDDRTERLVFDLAGVTFLDCAGIRALSIAARLAPGACPVIIRSLSPMARRIAELLDLDLANLRGLSLSRELPDGPRDGRTGQQEPAPAEPSTPFLAGTEGCP